MQIRLLGAHNCESLSTRLPGILLDDVLALDAGGLTSNLTFSAQQNLKAVLLTHPHYDHIRDIPALAMNLYLAGAGIDIYCTQAVREALTTHFLNGKVYPAFHERPPENPTLRFHVMEPGKIEQIEGYSMFTVPLPHAVPAVGYHVTSSDDTSLFYTGDTGYGLSECWQQTSPQLLIIEVTASSEYYQFGQQAGHLTPNLLKQELVAFRDLKGYLPRVLAVHMSPGLEDKIKAELAVVSEELNVSITPGYEGMQLQL